MCPCPQEPLLTTENGTELALSTGWARDVRYISTRCHLSALSFGTPAKSHLLSHPLNDSFRLRVKDDLLSFICFYILREKPLNTKDGEWSEDESEEDHQNRVREALKGIETWDWGAGGEDYLKISESVIRDCRSIDRLGGLRYALKEYQ